MNRDRSSPPVPPAGIGQRGFGRARMQGQVEKPKNLRATMKRLWTFLSKEKKWLAAVFLLIVSSSLLTLAGPYLLGVAVDAIDREEIAYSLLYAVLLALVAAYAADSLFSFLQGWIMAGLSQRIVWNLRKRMFAKLQKLPLAFFDSRPHGEVMSRLSNDMDNVSNTISQATTQFMSGLIAIVGSLVMMIVLSPLLTLAALITVPMVSILARAIARKTRILFRQQQHELGQLNGHVEETISGLQVVKAYNHEQHAISRFEEVNERMYKASLQAQIWSGFLMPLLGDINNIGFVTVAVVGGVLAVNGRISVGVIASFILYSRQFVRPLNELANTYAMLQSGVAGAERAFEILDEQEEPPDPPHAVELGKAQGAVEFRNVSFGYRPGHLILKGVSFRVEAGSTIALIGPTGAGKTTIVNLLTRFYDVTKGQILIDGRDIRDYTRDSLRRCFGVVLQDTYLFSGTVRENILYGRPDAGETEVLQAAKLANADGFIRRLPKGYDTMLTENGGNLSHGQRQLLAIARVILADPAILILDEATSSIDTRTELHIQDALRQLMKGRTSFVIAHRLNTIRDADLIMVVQQGEIAECGTHEELLRRGGVYHNMLIHQYQRLGLGL